MTNPLLIAFGIVVMSATLMIFFAIQTVLERRRKAWKERTQDATGEENDPLILKSRSDESRAWNEKMDEGFEQIVEGSLINMPADKVLAILSLLAVLVGGGLYLWRGQFWVSVVGGVAGLVVPLLTLWFFQGRARAEIQQQLPDFLYLLSRSLRSGMNLEYAIRLAIDQNMKPISSQLKPVLADLQLGLPLPQALKRVAVSIRSLDFETFVSVVAFHRINGGNLSLLLDRLGRNVRDRNQFRGHLQSTTAQARFTALLVGMAGPLLLVGYAVFQPEHVQPFFQSVWGWGILIATLTVELVAAVVMYQILRIDY